MLWIDIKHIIKRRLFYSRTQVCIEPEMVCNKYIQCPLHDDELLSLCQSGVNPPRTCDMFWGGDRRITKRNIFCSLIEVAKMVQSSLNWAPHFSLTNFSIRPPLAHRPRSVLVMLQSKLMTDTKEQSELVTVASQPSSLGELQCGYGIPVYFRTEVQCLCPPNLYGFRCEYQNERVSITLQIGATEWRTPFVLFVYLLDDTYEIINSYHHIRYLSIRDCGIKFDFHLLYSSQPKLVDHSYSIRIDALEMTTLNYRASWLFPVLFPFLPVYRLSAKLAIPFGSVSTDIYCPLKCKHGHGRCTTFAISGQFFCQCNPGWSGRLCTKPYECNCSPLSICVGTWKNKSICVCSTHQFGRRCYLSNNLCQKPNARKCQNGGQCIPRDNRIPVDSSTVCSCPDGFYGETCQLNQTRIDISIKVSNLAESLLLHFITVNSHMASVSYFPTNEWGPHARATTFKRIPFDQDLTSIYWSNLFHLLFSEYDGDIYLLLIQYKNNLVDRYNTSLESSNRCLSIREVLNDTIINLPRLHRVKYYHVPCQKRIDLRCFQDADQFMCICTHDRRANCFTFDHHVNYNCSELSYCENGGQCFQNAAKCPTASLCSCPKCYLGTRCQLSTRGFGLSLDIFLGYQIRPELSFTNQPLPIKVSGILTIVMLIIGVINSTLCILTFRRPVPREVGCGIYLFLASVISILTMTVFSLKYALLILTQLKVITNNMFLNGHCVIVDFLLKVFLHIGDWLYTCVAIERLISLIKGVGSNKKLTRKIAKWIILFVAFFVIGTSIQEPLYRTLITDEEEKRIWCVIRYPKSHSALLNRYTTITSVVHFIGPFVINVISTFGIITVAASYRSKAKTDLSYGVHFRNQLVQHKYLIFSNFILIILAVPRIILAFTLECMKSARESVMLFLIGYFISFVPPIVLFIVFVLPSDVYLKEFKKAISRK
jgi:hypothetical protein